MAKETHRRLFLGDDQPACQWCGEQHGAERLCQRAQRGMTRRSFCFLFGAGIAATALGVGPTLAEPTAFRGIVISEELIRDCAVNIEELVRKAMIAGMSDFIDTQVLLPDWQTYTLTG